MAATHLVGRRIIAGVLYITHVFKAVGDELRPHHHGERPEQLHVTLITAGSFELTGARAGQVANAGDFLEWAVDELHGLKALTPGATAVNVRPALPGESEKALA